MQRHNTTNNRQPFHQQNLSKRIRHYVNKFNLKQSCVCNKKYQKGLHSTFLEMGDKTSDPYKDTGVLHNDNLTCTPVTVRM